MRSMRCKFRRAASHCRVRFVEGQARVRFPQISTHIVCVHVYCGLRVHRERRDAVEPKADDCNALRVRGRRDDRKVKERAFNWSVFRLKKRKGPHRRDTARRTPKYIGPKIDLQHTHNIHHISARHTDRPHQNCQAESRTS